MKTTAILLKLRRDEVKDGWVSGALCVADASTTLQRPHVYYSREEMEQDERPVRVWRTVNYARYHESCLQPGLYQIKMRWNRKLHAFRPYVILSGEDETDEKRIILRPATEEDTGVPKAILWDEKSADRELPQYVKEQTLRRRISTTLKCDCEVWLRVE